MEEGGGGGGGGEERKQEGGEEGGYLFIYLGEAEGGGGGGDHPEGFLGFGGGFGEPVAEHFGDYCGDVGFDDGWYGTIGIFGYGAWNVVWSYAPPRLEVPFYYLPKLFYQRRDGTGR